MDKSSLTVDYRQMEKMTAKDALKSTRREAPLPSFLASLTPTQLAEMFPDYFKRALPDIGKRATSGATPMTGPPGLGQTARPYSPPVRTQARSSPGVKLRDGRTMPPQEPGVLLGPLGIDSSGYKKPQQSSGVKLSWQQALEQGAQPQASKGLMKSIPNASPLGKNRQQVDAQFMNRDTKLHMYALTIAEVGRKDEDSQRALMETIYNRYDAQKKDSLMATMGSDYYEPLRTWTRGYQNYQKALRDLQRDPTLFARMEKRHDEVLAGSNDSNFGTHNSSAGVASSAHRTQTVTAELGSRYKETYSRKDLAEWAWEHGPGTTKNEREWYQRMLDAENKWAMEQASQSALAEASKLPKKDPSQTGKIEPDAMLKPGETPKELQQATTIPQGLDPEAEKFLGTVTPETQARMIENINRMGVEQANRLFQESRDAQPQKAASSVTRDVAGQIIESKAPEKLTPGDTSYLGLERNPNLKGTDPQLLAVLNEGARRFQENNPGYRVVINGTVENGKMVGGGGSAMRYGGKNKSSYHRVGEAFDMTIVTPDGTALENFQSGEFAKEYQMLANFMKASQEKYAPDWKRFRGGLYFGGSYALDMMHFDRDYKRLGMGSGGNWETGFTKAQMRRFGIDPKTNMGMAEFRQIYGYDVAEARRQANEQMIAMKASSAEGLATASEVEPKDQAPNGAIDPYSNLGTTINLGEYKVPEDMPFSTEGFDKGFTKYWNTIMTQEQRAAAMDEVYKQYQDKTSGVPSFLMPDKEEIQRRIREGMENDYKARIDRGEIQPPPLTDAATVMPKAPQASTMTIGQPQLDVQGTMAADQKAKAQQTPQAAPKQEAPPAPKPEPPPMPKQEPLPLPADSLVPNYLGGGQQFMGEDSTLVDAAGKVKARFGGGEKVQITPQHRMSGSELLTQARATQASGERIASEKQASMEKQQKPRPKPNTPQHDPGLSIQENTRLLGQSSYPYKTTSNHRAMHRARNFSELSVDPAAGHFSEGATNMK